MLPKTGGPPDVSMRLIGDGHRYDPDAFYECLLPEVWHINQIFSGKALALSEMTPSRIISTSLTRLQAQADAKLAAELEKARADGYPFKEPLTKGQPA